MTDRELLELAAKAAGITALRDSRGFLRNCTNVDPAQNIFYAPLWHPLTDDGDALRLAGKLKMYLLFQEERVVAILDGFSCSEERKNDIGAETRRAIVRAAAEIGRSM